MEKEMMMNKNKGNKKAVDDDKMSKYVAIGVGVAAVVGVGLLAWGVSKLLSGSGERQSKMMKAPGRPGVFISRDEFESNTPSYFRHLRNDS